VIECRIIAATNRDLAAAAASGLFRADLYYRLSVLTVELPPLRERAGDVEVLARHFVEQLTHEHGTRPKRLPPETLQAMSTYYWPGNVRELRNAIEGALVLEESDIILPEHIRIRRRYSVPSPLAVDGQPPAAAILLPHAGLSLRDAEKQLIEATLKLAGHNQSEAARMLRISRPTLARKIRAYRINVERPTTPLPPRTVP
jgi:two-component system response regulator HydG